MIYVFSAREGGDTQELSQTSPKRRRNRIHLSCTSCFLAKRSCDRKRPCSRCKEHGTGTQCAYQQPSEENQRSIPVLATDISQGRPHSHFSPLQLLNTPNLYHTTFYADDGDVILATLDRHGCVGALFRVCSERLSCYSQKLRDLLTAGFARAPGEVYDGCAVLRLQETTSTVESLFTVLWNGPWVEEQEDLPADFILEVYDISTSWEITRTLRWSVERLERKVPTTYLALLGGRALSVFRNWISPSDVIRVAEESNRPRLAAAARLFLLTIDWIARPDQPTIDPPAQPGSTLTVSASSSLNAQNWSRLLVGQQRIQHRWAIYWVSEVESMRLKSQNCTTPVHSGTPSCTLQALGLSLLAAHSLGGILEAPFLDKLALKVQAKELCSNCYGHLASSLTAFWISLMDDLHILFDI